MTMSSNLDGDSTRDEPLVLVCAYPDGMLANTWFRAYKRVKRKATRTRLHARVELTPMSDLPPRIDVLFVPPELADVAQQVHVSLGRMVSVPEDLLQSFGQLAERLISDSRLGYHDEPDPAYAVHRGFWAMTGRATCPTDPRSEVNSLETTTSPSGARLPPR